MIKRLRHKDTAIEFDAFFPAVLRVCNPQRNMPPPAGARRLFGVFRSPLQGFFGCGPATRSVTCPRQPAPDAFSVFLGRPYRAFSGVGLTQGGTPCGRLPWAILGRAFSAEDKSPQRHITPQTPTLAHPGANRAVGLQPAAAHHPANAYPSTPRRQPCCGLAARSGTSSRKPETTRASAATN
jgi:hypothetical protein